MNSAVFEMAQMVDHHAANDLTDLADLHEEHIRVLRILAWMKSLAPEHKQWLLKILHAEANGIPADKVEMPAPLKRRLKGRKL